MTPTREPRTTISSSMTVRHAHLWACQGGCELPIHECAEARPTVEQLAEALRTVDSDAVNMTNGVRDDPLTYFDNWAAAILAALDRAAAGEPQMFDLAIAADTEEST